MLVGHLAGLLLRMIKAGLHGLYHAVGAEAMTKYEFGLRLARRFGFDGSLISRHSVDNAGLSARRSHNLDLSVHKLSTALDGVFPDFSTGLDEFYTQYTQGYPQQIRSYQQEESGRKRAPLKSVRP
jgi:dTDP-4-dehydrorhamnose reductase